MIKEVPAASGSLDSPTSWDTHIWTRFVQPLIPPYVKDMNEAVERVLEHKFGKGALFTSDYPHDKAFEYPSIATGTKYPDKEAIECTKAFCHYVSETYGRFPAFVGPVSLPVAVTLHHLDLDF